MKKHTGSTFLLIILISLSLTTLAQVTAPGEKKTPQKPPSSPPPPPSASNVFTVRTAIEFVNAIGSNRTIQLVSGSRIYLPDATDMQGDNFRFQEVYDGLELVIFGVNNLKIVGLGSTPVEMITDPVYGNVLTFDDCANITIENVNAGHGVEKGACTGGVFYLINSRSVNIRNTIMYGSGMEGITADGVTGLTVTNSVIWGCTYSIMSIMNSSGVEFSNCRFRDNEEFDQINIYNTLSSIIFRSCTITGNRTGMESYSDYSLFNVNSEFPVILENCIIQNNNTVYFATSPDAVKLINTPIGTNTFSSGTYKN